MTMDKVNTTPAITTAGMETCGENNIQIIASAASADTVKVSISNVNERGKRFCAYSASR